MLTNIFMILIGGSLVLLMLYSFYLVLLGNRDKKMKMPDNTFSASDRRKIKVRMSRRP